MGLFGIVSLAACKGMSHRGIERQSRRPLVRKSSSVAATSHSFEDGARLYVPWTIARLWLLLREVKMLGTTGKCASSTGLTNSGIRQMCIPHDEG